MACRHELAPATAANYNPDPHWACHMTKEGTSVPRSAAAASPPHACRFLPGIAFTLMLLAAAPVEARVLDDSDLERISGIKTSFTDVVTDMAQSSRRPDLSSGDSDCMNSALRELLQISEELKSYEYLITIENQLSDFGDDNAMKGILRFAVDKALDILAIERKRLGQLSDQCSRYPLSAGKTQAAIRFIDGTTAILKSLQPRL
jgi:hypothetical protein